MVWLLYDGPLSELRFGANSGNVERMVALFEQV